MTIVFAKQLPLGEVEQLWEKGEMNQAEAISHLVAWIQREIDPAWPPRTRAVEGLVAAVRAECAKFNFPDEDRPELWAALQELDHE